jgi:hypothetical protein
MSPSKSDALAGVSVVLLESRMSREMGDLVRRYGGAPRFVPAVRETPIECRGPVASFLRTLETAAARVVVFLTAVGANVLFDEAERQDGFRFARVAVMQRSYAGVRSLRRAETAWADADRLGTRATPALNCSGRSTIGICETWKSC